MHRGGISTGSPCPPPPQHSCVHTTLTPIHRTEEGHGEAAASHPLLLVRVHKALVHNGASGCSKGKQSRSNDYSQLQRRQDRSKCLITAT